MLKRVVFILEKENGREEIETLQKELAGHGILTVVEENMIEEMAWESWNKKALTEEIWNGEETLYITDSSFFQKQLDERNVPVIIYLHEGNWGEDFSHAEYAIEQIREIEYESLELAYLRLTGQPWTILTTDRCKIRETTTEDVDYFYEIYKEPSITAYMENLYEDKEEELVYIQDYIKKVYGFYGYGMWTVLEKTGGQVIGRAGISWREGYDIPELGFVIAVPYQRQGYAYEVCQAILSYGKEELGFSCFQALIMEGNTKSKALCGKLGFTYEETVEIQGIVYERFLCHV